MNYSNSNNNNNNNNSNGSTTTVILSEWKKQMITKDDEYHIHKTLGIIVLISFIWRLRQINNDMGFSIYPSLTLPTIILHLTLNVSSYIFHIPVRRIKSGGYRIWPEYRSHSLIFLCRSLLMILVFHIEQRYNVIPNHILNIIVILVTMMAADYVTYKSKYTSGFARELGVPAIARYFFSTAQLAATSMILVGQRRYTMQFLMIIIIQGNAFLMTVRRKGLASQTTLTIIYGLAITFAGIISYFEYTNHGEAGFNTFRAVAFIANTTTILRTGPRIIPILCYIQDNKYILWISMYLLLHYIIRPAIMEKDFTWGKRCCVLGSTFGLFALGGYKHIKEEKRK